MPDGTETESVDVRKSPPAISVTYNEKELSEKFLNVVSCNGNIHKVSNRIINNNNNNKHFFNLQVANFPSRLRFEANLSRESSECTKHSQDQMSQINTGKTVCRKCLIKEICFEAFSIKLLMLFYHYI